MLILRSAGMREISHYSPQRGCNLSECAPLWSFDFVLFRSAQCWCQTVALLQFAWTSIQRHCCNLRLQLHVFTCLSCLCLVFVLTAQVLVLCRVSSRIICRCGCMCSMCKKERKSKRRKGFSSLVAQTCPEAGVCAGLVSLPTVEKDQYLCLLHNEMFFLWFLNLGV